MNALVEKLIYATLAVSAVVTLWAIFTPNHLYVG